jgi:hypothetical protein
VRLKGTYAVGVEPASIVTAALLMLTLSRSVWQAVAEGVAMDLNPLVLLTDWRFYVLVIFMRTFKIAVQSMDPPGDGSGELYRWAYRFGHQMVTNVIMASEAMRRSPRRKEE